MSNSDLFKEVAATLMTSEGSKDVVHPDVMKDVKSLLNWSHTLLTDAVFSHSGMLYDECLDRDCEEELKETVGAFNRLMDKPRVPMRDSRK
jgi:hypothetical protein